MKYIFKTKFVQDEARNGQLCEIVEITSEARDNSLYDLVNIKFADGYVTECYRLELEAEK